MHQLLNGQLANSLTFQIVFYWGTAIPLALLQGGGWVGSHEVAGKDYIFTKNSQMAFIGVIFPSTYHKVAKSTAKLTSQLCGDLQPAGCLSPGDGPSQHSWTSDRTQKNKPQQKQLGQLSALLADMLASVYSYHVMVKSISFCCVRGRRVISNPVTIE